jgi:hypothetical protein
MRNEGIRYHLKEFHNSILGRPRNKEELFNLRHASFRNQIERAFGVMKKRFRILREPLVLDSIGDMMKTYYSCVALHNFIRKENKAVDANIESQVLNDEVFGATEQMVSNFEVDDADAESWRDSIARNMWIDYVATHSEYNNAV